MCEAALDDDPEIYRHVAESPLPEPVVQEQDDKAEWWQRYEIDLWNTRPVRVWVLPLLTPADPAEAFENSARGIYALAGLSPNETESCLRWHQGWSEYRIARALDRQRATVQVEIRRGEAKLALLGA